MPGRTKKAEPVAQDTTMEDAPEAVAEDAPQSAQVDDTENIEEEGDEFEDEEEAEPQRVKIVGNRTSHLVYCR